MIGRLRTVYGASPAHLVGHLLLFAGAGYAIVQLADARDARGIAMWLIGLALFHDLVFLPAYTALDRFGLRALPALRLPIVNHIRFVAIVAGALLLVWFPLILDRAPANYVRATGHEPPDYLGRWLSITAGLIAVSAAAYAVRVLRARRIEELHDPVVAAPNEDAPRA
jgi:hypothetical protein